jgi:epoxyqueuosine reductase
MVPFQYYEDDLNAESLRTIVQKEIIKEPGHRVVDISQRVPLKLLAARSGLGRYGRNNLVFVDGMGSYSLLYAFLTDYTFPGDDWSSMDILDECNRCHRCESSCPTSCIDRRSFSIFPTSCVGQRSFAIDVDHCITLYNENPGPFPNWIHPSMHHALMGCMRCQSPCPANFEEVTAELGDITEDETRKILAGTPDDALLVSLQRKLRAFPAYGSKEMFPLLTRNLSVLIRS